MTASVFSGLVEIVPSISGPTKHHDHALEIRFYLVCDQQTGRSAKSSHINGRAEPIKLTRLAKESHFKDQCCSQQNLSSCFLYRPDALLAGFFIYIEKQASVFSKTYVAVTHFGSLVTVLKKFNVREIVLTDHAKRGIKAKQTI